jgi:hypothetical protein
LGPAIAGIGSVILADIFQQTLFSNLDNYPLTILLFVWLFGARCAIGSRNTISPARALSWW